MAPRVSHISGRVHSETGKVARSLLAEAPGPQPVTDT